MINQCSLVLMTNAPCGLEGVPTLTLLPYVWNSDSFSCVWATVPVRPVKIVSSPRGIVECKRKPDSKKGNKNQTKVKVLWYCWFWRHRRKILSKKATAARRTAARSRWPAITVFSILGPRGRKTVRFKHPALACYWPSRLQMLEWKPQAFPDTFQMNQPNISHDSHCFSIVLAACYYPSGHIRLIPLKAVTCNAGSCTKRALLINDDVIYRDRL